MNEIIVSDSPRKTYEVVDFCERKKNHRMSLFGKRDNALKDLNCEKSPCRICLESESTDLNSMIQPCNCTGLMKLVHEECLKVWIVSFQGNIDRAYCDLCHSRFLMVYELIREFPEKRFRKVTLQCLFIPVLLIMILILLLIFIVLIDSFFSDKLDNTSKSYNIGLAISCLISSGVIFAVTIKVVKSNCFPLRLENWRILNVPDNGKGKHDIIEHDLEKFEEKRKKLMVIPKKLKVQEYKVNVPLLLPNLNPITRHEKLIAYTSRYFAPVSGIAHQDSDTFSESQHIKEDVVRHNSFASLSQSN